MSAVHQHPCATSTIIATPSLSSMQRSTVRMCCWNGRGVSLKMPVVADRRAVMANKSATGAAQQEQHGKQPHELQYEPAAVEKPLQQPQQQQQESSKQELAAEAQQQPAQQQQMASRSWFDAATAALLKLLALAGVTLFVIVMGPHLVAGIVKVWKWSLELREKGGFGENATWFEMATGFVAACGVMWGGVSAVLSFQEAVRSAKTSAQAVERTRQEIRDDFVQLSDTLSKQLSDKLDGYLSASALQRLDKVEDRQWATQQSKWWWRK